jgi:hypothetical protein
MVYDFILTILLSIIVNVFVTKPFARLLDLFMKKNDKIKVEILDEKDELMVNGNGKAVHKESKDNDVIVIKNVAFNNSPVLNDKQKVTDTWLQNLSANNNFDENNNNFVANNVNNTNEVKDVSIKM